MKTLKCIYHRTDLDGSCSAAIINYKYRMTHKIHLIGLDNGEKFDWSLISKNDDLIFMVDISLPIEDMLKLKAFDNFIFIDHHITAIERSIKYNYENIRGIRNINYAACELVWNFLFHENPLPKAINLLGRFDLYRLNDIPNILEFQNGMKIQNTNPFNIKLWNQLFKNNNDSELLISNIISDGKIILEYLKQNSKSLLKYKYYPIKFEGINFIASNAHMIDFTVLYENDMYKKYDAILIYEYRHDVGKWKIHMRSNNNDVDILSIAKKYGGGGHPRSNGFDIDELPKEFYGKEI